MLMLYVHAYLHVRPASLEDDGPQDLAPCGSRVEVPLALYMYTHRTLYSTSYSCI